MTTVPFTILSHVLWTVLIFGAYLAVHRKARESGVEMVELFSRFFLSWSLGFFGLLVVLIQSGIFLGNSTLMTLGYVVPHLFAFIALGYLWRVQSSIHFPAYDRLFYAFVGAGALIVAVGLWEMPAVTLEAGSIVFGPGSIFSRLIPLGMTVAALIIAVPGYYSAYQTHGSSRVKLALISTGTLLIIAGAILHNIEGIATDLAGELANAAFIGAFLAAIFWDRVSEVL